MTEHSIQTAILATLGSGHGMRLWRNNVGTAYRGVIERVPGGILIRRPQVIHFGLCVGSSDLIGYTMRDGVAVFTALEVKGRRGRLTDEQERFIAKVLADGGIAGVVRSVEEALRLTKK